MREREKILILSLLGIENKIISFIYLNFTNEEIEKLLLGNVLELQFKYNIFDDNAMNLLLDAQKVLCATDKANKILQYSFKQDIHVISIFEEDYPVLLKKIHNPPLFLYAIGNLNLLNSNNAIACVGTRKPSKIGIEAVNNLITGLSKQNYTIVSGLAYGIDYAAHKTCLDNDGKTIAVLAHGLDKIYPKEHLPLSKKILQKNGLLLSEYPVFTDIKKEYFVQRNRIVSGISNGTIVIEADENSGTMHTARFAFKQERMIFSPLNNTSSGVQKLISTKNAIPIKSFDEIVNYYSSQNERKSNIVLEKILSRVNLQFNQQENKNNIMYKKCTTKIDSVVYSRIQNLASENNLTIKEIVNGVLQAFVDTYEEGEKK
ncbi:DNA-processing protein DprA [Paenibacillus sp. PsM32]|uniref:DNA-processing protein DprA n=1 Tax=Paenibacillus sp. PsM32 TaxID=3030536 RepID=UPI00263A40C3|nr:DNA-processing protein DprA [Paenibacillus sp. PsM32]MDN4617696.1 DNA-processing protein DprA [Paenibacillus sp. PsM32]